jgi:hypothetical protein
VLASQGTILWNCFSWSLNLKPKELFIIAAVSYQPLWQNWFVLYSILTVISLVDFSCTWISKFRPKIIMLINFDKIWGECLCWAYTKFRTVPQGGHFIVKAKIHFRIFSACTNLENISCDLCTILWVFHIIHHLTIC